jgi:hypothetical protein
MEINETAHQLFTDFQVNLGFSQEGSTVQYANFHSVWGTHKTS